MWDNVKDAISNCYKVISEARCQNCHKTGTFDPHTQALVYSEEDRCMADLITCTCSCGFTKVFIFPQHHLSSLKGSHLDGVHMTVPESSLIRDDLQAMTRRVELISTHADTETKELAAYVALMQSVADLRRKIADHEGIRESEIRNINFLCRQVENIMKRDELRRPRKPR